MRRNKRKKLKLGRVLLVISCIGILVYSAKLVYDHNFKKEVLSASVRETSSVDGKNNTPVPTPTPTPTPVQVSPTPETTNNPKQSNINNINIKDYFKNSLFIGDSISEGIWYYEFLSEKNVIAKRGLNLKTAVKEIDSYTGVNPAKVYILFGANELVGKTTAEDYLSDYKKVIGAVRTKFKNTQVYVQSIFPVTSAKATSTPDLSKERVDEFNKKLQEFSIKDGIKYLDVASVLKDKGESLYEEDGLHFKRDFYPYWLDYVSKHN